MWNIVTRWKVKKCLHYKILTEEEKEKESVNLLSKIFSSNIKATCVREENDQTGEQIIFWDVALVTHSLIQISWEINGRGIFSLENNDARIRMTGPL